MWGNFWPVLALILIALPVYGAVVLAFGWSGSAISGDQVWGYYAAALLGNLVFAPLSALVVVVTYFELARIQSNSA